MRLITLLLITLLISGCATVYKAQNNILPNKKSPNYTYDSSTFDQVHDMGDNIIILAFSGGGTRAAALSYAVLQELNSTVVKDQNGESKSILDDVDVISSVSGGSFTAAYYGAFGKRIFKDYEDKFLRKSNESALISQMLNPLYWLKSLTTGFNRTELAIEYYDNNLFNRKTFADIPLDKGPLIIINSTDLSLGQRFSFLQESFDLICSDLSSFRLARAVTASSAVPILFPSVVLKNYSANCPKRNLALSSHRPPLKNDTQRKKDFLRMLDAYKNGNQRSYLHLVDGGLSDNLGLRTISDHFEISEPSEEDLNKSNAKRIMIILVNSTVEPAREMDQSPSNPSTSETLDAFTEALIQNRSSDTKGYFFDANSSFQQHMSSLMPDLDIYVSEISFTAIESENQRRWFNQLPTSLELSNEQIDQIISTGRQLLRKDKTFQRFVEDLSVTQ